MTKVTRVGLLMADPDLLFGRELLIGSQSDFQLVFSENSGQAALAKIESFNVDVLIVDQRTSDLDGLTFLTLLYGASASLDLLPKTIFQSPYFSRTEQVSALEAGAFGWVSGENTSDEILDQVRRVAKANASLDVLALRLQFEEAGIKKSAQPQLMNALAEADDKTLQIVKLFSRGLAIKEIAKELSLSKPSVEKFLVSFYQQLGFSSAGQLLLSLYRGGQLDDH